MQRWLAHRLKSGSPPRRRGSAAWRLLTALGLASVLGMTALAASASAATYGPYYIRAVNSGKCMDVKGGPSATANLTIVQQWTCWGGTNQQWYLQDTGDGSYYLMPANRTTACLDVTGGPTGVANGTPLQIWDCWGGSNQRWFLNRGANSSTNSTTIVAENSGTCSDVTGGPAAVADFIPLQIWDCWGGTNQSWYLTTTF